MDKTSQRKFVACHIETAVRTATDKLRPKIPNYNFDLMLDDFINILKRWESAK
jgi:hypothetical protein